MAYRERRFTAQDGLSLYWRDYGDPAAPRTPVLCLGGLTRNSKDYDVLAGRLSADRRVLCPDYRGRGRSDRDPDWRNYDPRTYINDILHLLTLADVHRVVVIGTSLGGLLAMGLSAALPSALAAVVLNDIGPEIEPAGLAHIIEYIRVDRPQPDWDSAVATIRRLLPDLAFQTEAMWQEMARNTYVMGEDGMLHFDWDTDIIRPTIENKTPVPDLWPYFRGLRDVPTLAFRGANSGLLSAACFERMGEAHPRLRRVTVPGTGHAPTLTEPECVAAIDDFLAEI